MCLVEGIYLHRPGDGVKATTPAGGGTRGIRLEANEAPRILEMSPDWADYDLLLFQNGHHPARATPALKDLWRWSQSVVPVGGSSRQASHLG